VNCKLARNPVVGLMCTIVYALYQTLIAARGAIRHGQVASFDFDNFHDFLVISTLTSALGTEIDLDVVQTSGSGPY
jgi:hypothetical protein